MKYFACLILSVFGFYTMYAQSNYKLVRADTTVMDRILFQTSEVLTDSLQIDTLFDRNKTGENILVYTPVGLGIQNWNWIGRRKVFVFLRESELDDYASSKNIYHTQMIVESYLAEAKSLLVCCRFIQLTTIRHKIHSSPTQLKYCFQFCYDELSESWKYCGYQLVE